MDILVVDHCANVPALRRLVSQYTARDVQNFTSERMFRAYVERAFAWPNLLLINRNLPWGITQAPENSRGTGYAGDECIAHFAERVPLGKTDLIFYGVGMYNVSPYSCVINGVLNPQLASKFKRVELVELSSGRELLEQAVQRVIK